MSPNTPFDGALVVRMIEAAPNPMLLVASDGRIEFVNAEFERFFGYTRDELLGTPVERLVPDYVRAQHPALRDGFFRDPMTLRIGAGRDFVGRRKDGSEVAFEIGLAPVRTERGLHALAALVDLTRRRSVELALRESEARFRSMADSAPVLLWVAGKDMGCTFFNRPWLEFRGRTLAEEQGHGWADGVHPEDRERCFDTYARCFEERVPFTMQYRLLRHDGEYRWLHDAGTPRFDTDGGFAGFIGSCIDVTESKRLADELQSLNQELELRVRLRTAELLEANRELEAFCRSVSHDLRAPLRHITGFAGYLLEEPAVRDSAEARRLAEVIERSSRKLGLLIDDLLAFSRMGRVELARRRVALKDVLDEVLADLTPEVEGRAVEWTISQLPEVWGDPALLRQVLANLLGNALKYTRPRDVARIAVESEMVDSEVVVRVRDNGVGFESAHAGRLFQVFERLHGEAEFEGTGVGLASVKRIVERHGGRVWAEAELGQGACFSVSLPRESDGRMGGAA
ncbi:MAG: PAS domain S-box protein [Planctomycetes bacterium]|nr:PAS domain S-box protein [Planctomycetota bacterium]